MTFWIAAFLLTMCATALVVWPLARPLRTPASASAHDVSVYRDQLDEVSRDVAGGSLKDSEAEAARAEIGRRLLRASSEERRETVDAGGRRLRGGGAAMIAVAVFIPVAGLAGYLALGSPGAPSMPLSAREAGPGGDPELAALIEKAQSHLTANPDDGRGWDVLAPIYLRTGRVQDAAIAYGNAIRLLGATAPREAGLGEALVMANRGTVTEAAADAFDRALALKPEDARAQFFRAVGLAQAGRRDDALTAFRTLKAQAPNDAAWMPMVENQIAALTGDDADAGSGAADRAAAPPGNPTAADMAAAGGMKADDRRAMIRGMVSRLDDRLTEQPDNLAGWKRLVRSYMVLGEPAKAQSALERALKAFPATSDGGRQLTGLAQDLGVDATGNAPKETTQ